MPTFILSLSWTDQGIRSVKDAPKRAQASRELAQKLESRSKSISPPATTISSSSSTLPMVTTWRNMRSR